MNRTLTRLALTAGTMLVTRLIQVALTKAPVKVPENCWPFHPDHPEGLHYHWGWGSRRVTLDLREALNSPYGTDTPFVTHPTGDPR